MRDILFRGKRKDNGEWVYGGLIWKEQSCCCAELPNTTYKKYYICYYDKEKGIFEDCEVDKDTIGQYTGLLDKNGNKIFEGDILYNNYNGQNGCVVFCNGDCIVEYLSYRDFDYLNFLIDYRVEIIGNKYDNSELLKVIKNERS